MVVSCEQGNEPSGSIKCGEFLDLEEELFGVLLHGFSLLSIQGLWSVNLSTVQSLHN